MSEDKNRPRDFGRRASGVKFKVKLYAAHIVCRLLSHVN